MVSKGSPCLDREEEFEAARKCAPPDLVLRGGLTRVACVCGRAQVTPKAYRVQFRHISCNGAHILGHAPFYRCGLAPRRVEVSPAESYFGVETDPGAAHLHKQDGKHPVYAKWVGIT